MYGLHVVVAKVIQAFQLTSLFCLGMLNAIVFGMDKETLSRLNCIQMKV